MAPDPVEPLADPVLVEDADVTVEVVVEVQVAVFADWFPSQVVPPDPPPDPSSDPALDPPPDPAPDPAPELILVIVADPALRVVAAPAPLVVPALLALAVPADLAVVRRADSMLALCAGPEAFVEVIGLEETRGGKGSSVFVVLDASNDDPLEEAEDVISSYLRGETWIRLAPARAILQ